MPALEGAAQSAGTPGYEAVVRTGIGADLLAGESRGRQGFIGSSKTLAMFDSFTAFAAWIPNILS